MTSPEYLRALTVKHKRKHQSQGVLKRALDGNASSEQAVKVGALTPLRAEMGLNIAMTKGDNL